MKLAPTPFLNALRVCGVCVGVLALEGCDSAKKMMGLAVETPDAFAVMRHPPLEMPPQFDLAPPQPGAKGRHHQVAVEKAESTVSSLLSEQQMKAAHSLAQPASVKKGADHPVFNHVQKAPEGVRAQLHADEATDRQSPTFLQQLARHQDKGEVINPHKELDALGQK